MNKKNRIIMIGPDIEGKGGVSRVVKIWKESKIFEELDIKYISTLSNSRYLFKIADLLKSIFYFIFLSSNSCRGVYIHTASRNSFYRKLIFITISIIFSNKIILHIHPTFFYSFLMNFYGIRKKCYFYLLNKVNIYVVLTNEMKENIKKLFPQKNIFVLRNPINLKTMENKNTITRDKNRLLYLGWYLKYKGVYDLIDAVELIIDQGFDVKLDLYGTYNIEKLKSYVSKKQIPKIAVNDWIDDKKKLEVLYKSTILILPSYSEGIPNVILEAMATKTPIVTTAVGGLKEILTDYENALFAKPKSPVDLSNKILKLLTNTNLREIIAANAFILAKKSFDLQIIEKQLKKIIINQL